MTDVGVIVIWSLTNQPQTFRPYTIQVKTAIRGIGPKRSVHEFASPSESAALSSQSVNHLPTLDSIWEVASTKNATKLANDCQKELIWTYINAVGIKFVFTKKAFTYDTTYCVRNAREQKNNVIRSYLDKVRQGRSLWRTPVEQINGTFLCFSFKGEDHGRFTGYFSQIKTGALCCEFDSHKETATEGDTVGV